MKLHKAIILAIMISAAALFACSEQPGQDGRAAQETEEQPRAYTGDEDKRDVDNQRDGMGTQEDMNKMNPPMAPGQQPVQPQQEQEQK